MVKEALLVTAGVIAAAAIFAAVRYQISKKQIDKDVERIFVDELNIGELKTWFLGKLANENRKGVVFYPTKENTEKWNIKMPENKNQLIQMVYDIQKYDVIAYREIAFTELSDKLKSLLDNNNGIFIIDK